MGKTLADINASIDGGKKLKGTNPLLDDIYNRLKPQEEYYADLNKRRGDRLEAERELKKALKAIGAGGAIGAAGGSGGGTDGAGGKSNILKILKGLGVGLGALGTAVAALKLRNVMKTKTPTVIDNKGRAVDDVKTRNAKANTRDYLRRIQGNDGRTPRGMFDVDPDSKNSFKPNKIRSALFKQQIAIQRTNARLAAESMRIQKLTASRALAARVASLQNQKIATMIALDDVKMEGIRRAKLLAEHKLLKSQIKAAQLEASRLKSSLASNKMFSEPQANRGFVIDSKGNIAPGLNEIRLNINDPKLKHLSDADLKRSGFVRTTSGVRILKADGSAGQVVKHDKVLKAVQRTAFLANRPGFDGGRLSRSGDPFKGLNTGESIKKTKLIPKINIDAGDPRGGLKGLRAAAGSHMSSSLKSLAKGVSNNVLKPIIQLLDSPYTGLMQLGNTLEQSNNFSRLGKGISGVVRVLGSVPFMALTGYLTMGTMAAASDLGSIPLSKEFTNMLKAMSSGRGVKEVKALATIFAKKVKPALQVSNAAALNPAERSVGMVLVSMMPLQDAEFITVYKQIYKMMHPGDPILNVRGSDADKIGSTGLSMHMTTRTAAKDFGLGGGDVRNNFTNNPLTNMKLLNSMRTDGVSGSISPSGAPVPLLTFQDGSASSGTAAPPVSIIDSSTKVQTEIKNMHGNDGLRSIDDNPRFGYESGQDFQQSNARYIR